MTIARISEGAASVTTKMAGSASMRQRGLRRFSSVVLLALAATRTTLSSAQPPPAQPPPAQPPPPPPPSAEPTPSNATELIPPEVISKGEPVYPEGQTTNANVVVEIVVGVDGSVEDARIVEGSPAFAEAALTAARQYRFKPALRGNRPVRARIRVAVAFEVTVEKTVPPEPPPEPPPPPIQLVKPAPVEEVHILGRREPATPTEHRMKRAEMRVMPGAFGDPFRAIDVLPSLVPIISGLPYFYIRGAPPSAVGYYIDEVKVPYLFHFALGPGVIQPALIDEVALHPAAFPGRYGRFAGGIVAGTTRDPAAELHGEAQIRLIDAGAYVETPLANGRASVGVGGRYSYTAAIISLFAPDVTIDYRDYNARASYQLTDEWRLSAFTFGSFDYASDVEDGVEQVFFASEFHRLDLRLDRRTKSSMSRIAATVGIDRTRIEGARFAQNWLTGMRGRHTWSAGRDVEMEIGADALAEHYIGDVPSRYAVRPEEYEQARTLFSPRTDTASGVWTSATWRPAPGWDLTTTLRGDAFTSDGKVAFGPSPRISAKVPIVSKVSFLAAMGVANQPPAFAIPVPAVGYRGLPGGLAFAYQKSAGLEIGLPLRFTLKTVGFHHSYFNLRDFARDRGGIDIDEAPPEPGGPSQGYGLEVFLSRKMSERYAAFTSFTLQRSQLGATMTAPAAVSPFDRTYVFQIGGVVDLGRGWKTSARFLTYGGWPLERDEETGKVVGRLPGFYRADARIEKKWTLAKERWISLVFEGLNVTGSKDIVGRQCATPDRCRSQELGPIVVPSIGVEGGL